MAVHVSEAAPVAGNNNSQVGGSNLGGLIVEQQPFRHVYKDEKEGSMQVAILRIPPVAHAEPSLSPGAITASVAVSKLKISVEVRRSNDFSAASEPEQSFHVSLDDSPASLGNERKILASEVDKQRRFSYMTVTRHPEVKELVLILLKSDRDQKLGKVKELYMLIHVEVDGLETRCCRTDAWTMMSKKKNTKKIDRIARAPEYYNYFMDIQYHFRNGLEIRHICPGITWKIETAPGTRGTQAPVELWHGENPHALYYDNSIPLDAPSAELEIPPSVAETPPASDAHADSQPITVKRRLSVGQEDHDTQLNKRACRTRSDSFINNVRKQAFRDDNIASSRARSTSFDASFNASFDSAPVTLFPPETESYDATLGAEAAPVDHAHQNFSGDLFYDGGNEAEAQAVNLQDVVAEDTTLAELADLESLLQGDLSDPLGQDHGGFETAVATEPLPGSDASLCAVSATFQSPIPEDLIFSNDEFATTGWDVDATYTQPMSSESNLVVLAPHATDATADDGLLI